MMLSMYDTVCPRCRHVFPLPAHPHITSPAESVSYSNMSQYRNLTESTDNVSSDISPVNLNTNVKSSYVPCKITRNDSLNELMNECNMLPDSDNSDYAFSNIENNNFTSASIDSILQSMKPNSLNIDLSNKTPVLNFESLPQTPIQMTSRSAPQTPRTLPQSPLFSLQTPFLQPTPSDRAMSQFATAPQTVNLTAQNINITPQTITIVPHSSLLPQSFGIVTQHAGMGSQNVTPCPQTVSLSMQSGGHMLQNIGMVPEFTTSSFPSPSVNLPAQTFNFAPHITTNTPHMIGDSFISGSLNLPSRNSVSFVTQPIKLPSKQSIDFSLSCLSLQKPNRPVKNRSLHQLSGGGIIEDKNQSFHDDSVFDETDIEKEFNERCKIDSAENTVEPTSPLCLASKILPSPFLPNFTSKDMSKIEFMNDDVRLHQTLVALNCSGWYYEGVSWQEVEAMLRSSPDGTFIIRESSNPNYLFTLTVKTPRDLNSVRIQYCNGTFQLDCVENVSKEIPRFKCVVELVEYYVKRSAQMTSLNNEGHKTNIRDMLFDSEGVIVSVVLLRKPLLKKDVVPSLMHSARLVINRALSENKKRINDKLSTLLIPKCLMNYLNEYPYII